VLRGGGTVTGKRRARTKRVIAVIAGLVAAAALLGGCTMHALAPLPEAASYQRVGVLSAMGDRFSIQELGFTVFGNEYKAQNLPIGADDIITAELKQSLAGRYTVVDLSQYRAAFMNAPKYWPGEQSLISESRPEVTEVVRQLMGKENLDAYVLVTAAYGAIGATNQAVAGIGILKFQGVIRDNAYRLHALYIVSVIDGHSYELTGHMRAFQNGESEAKALLFSGSAIRGPNVEVPGAWWDAPAGHEDEIKAAFQQMMDQSIPQTLRDTKLVQ
jgi:hypothetical protein